MPSPSKSVASSLKQNKALSGILLMVLHALAMSIMYILAKDLNQKFEPFQVTFLYKFTILICILPWCLQGNYKANLKTRRIGLHVARGTFSLLGTLCFFEGLKHNDVLSSAAITYLEHILVTIIGLWYFKEKLSLPKIVLILCSFIGALFIIKPGYGEFNFYYVYLLLAVFFWALNNTVIKLLGSTERTKAQLFYVMLFSSMFSFPIALPVWKPIELQHMQYILAIAGCYLVHSVAFFKAFKYADLSTVMPFDYCRLVFTGILGVLILHEMPDQHSFIGYILIVAGGINAIVHQARYSKKISEAKKSQLEAEYEQL